jgi:hypothetical protein
MLLFDGFLGLVFLGLWIFCIIDVITTPDGECRNLPKLAWLVIVVLLSDIGSVAWLVTGRNGNDTGTRTPARPVRATTSSVGSGKPSRRVPANPDDDEEFLSTLRARAEEQRRRAREAQQAAEEKPEDDS